MTATTRPVTGREPVAPDDTATLFDLWGRVMNAGVGPSDPEAEQFVAEHGGLYDVAAVIAVARAVCPPGFLLVPPDDLAEAIETLIEAARHAEFDRIYTLVDDDARPRRERALTEAKAALLALLTGKEEVSCGA